MRRKFFIGIFIVVIFISAFSGIHYRAIIPPAQWPEPVYDFTRNPLTSEGIELGRVLFYDPKLSADSTISCASCHNSYNAFTHVDHPRSHGIHDRIGKRNAPALMNLAWQSRFMWDGAVNHLDMQPLAPISNPDEMASDFALIVKRLNESQLYRGLFFDAFDDSLVTGEHVLKAMSQFMLTLVSANSRYDKMKRGELVYSIQEEHGYALFKTKCASCHVEPLFSSDEFVNNGIGPNSELNDNGRMDISLQEGDLRKFKIPSLRNCEFSYPYMHDGRFRRLSDVLKHYANVNAKNAEADGRLHGDMSLSPNDQVDLTAFLLTLTDKEFLFNPDFSFPKK